MRRPLSMTLAAMIAAGSALATLAPAAAATKTPAYASSASSGIELVRDSHNDGWNPDNRWNDNRWNNNRWNDNDNDWDNHRHRHHRPSFFPQLFFQFPYAYAPRTYYRHDCFRSLDGRLYCSR